MERLPEVTWPARSRAGPLQSLCLPGTDQQPNQNSPAGSSSHHHNLDGEPTEWPAHLERQNHEARGTQGTGGISGSCKCGALGACPCQEGCLLSSPGEPRPTEQAQLTSLLCGASEPPERTQCSLALSGPALHPHTYSIHLVLWSLCRGLPPLQD